MVISKGSYVYGELKNVLLLSVQKTYLPVWGRKIPPYMFGGIGSRMEIYETSCTRIPMVPRLHQSNGNAKGKLHVWRAQNVLPSSVQNTYLTVWGRKIPRHMGGGIGQRMETCELSCTPIPMETRLRQRNSYIKGKLHVWRAQKCTALLSAKNALTSVES